MLITVIGRGHSGTRAMSHTLSKSGVWMGEPLNGSGDLVPPESMYEACREFAKYVSYSGGMKWDFSRVLEMDPTPRFRALIADYLHSVLDSNAPIKGWKIPETTLVYPWILKLFPDAYYIHWIRDPRDGILSAHMTDDLNDFGIDYDKTDNIRRNRAISWKYQRELTEATPMPAKTLSVRFEDMVFKQDETLARLEKFLGIPLAKIEMRRDPVGRYLSDEGEHDFDFFREDLIKNGYEAR